MKTIIRVVSFLFIISLAACTLPGQQTATDIPVTPGNGSILITSQLPVEQWHEYLGDPTVADAILDRLVHRAHRIELRGESLRKTNKTA